MASSVLFKSSDGAVVGIDIPRSLEEAQVLPGQTITRHIISTHPREAPWQTPEPKKNTTRDVSASAAIAELMTLESVKSALGMARTSHNGPWCLPRVSREKTDVPPSTVQARPGTDGNDNAARPHKRKHKPSSSLLPLTEDKETVFAGAFVPEQSHYLLGTIQSQHEAFLQDAPQFDLVVLDPPWPSRSVKRKSDSYTTVHSTEEARELLSQIPLASHLKRDGLVAIWVTNKASITDLLLAPGGILGQWGLEPVGEWIWLKITSTGEPVLDIESAWRKPWERLLIARKVGSRIMPPMSTKVILGVPDMHSRKPNLRGLFDETLPKGYAGLEIFARNLTAGWWSWGNEVLLFQQKHHWVPLEDEQDS
ncbi:putative MT-A70 family [Rosellinia necatrix]|uniref:Putative MT-A70 family n=1 Tax=Rosellinia necatrix TaxID=77044 RepID=A0A1W2TPV5_ROSNE|nr:putative MT-A70 family [Rosellinia necatrix]